MLPFTRRKTPAIHRFCGKLPDGSTSPQVEGLPATVRRAGPQAAERTVEFFTAQIRNPHTRAAVVPRLDAPPTGRPSRR